MKNIFTLLVSLFTLLVSLLLVTGCVADTETYYEDDDVTEEDNDSPGLGYNGGSHWSSCSKYEVFEFQTPDGEVYIIELPVWCNLFYIDEGDPPPENPLEEVVNPYDYSQFTDSNPVPKF